MLYGQVSKESEGIVELRIEKNWTEDYAVNRAKEEAKVNAIENAFGSVVSQGNSLYVKNLKTGKLSENTTVFNSISEILVNGEWIKTLDENVTFYDKDNYRWVKVYVKGEIRELVNTPFLPEVTTLNCAQDDCITTEYKSGQQLIVKFKSPVNGFVSVYLEDGKNAQRLLPYSNQKGVETYAIQADKDYYFFSRSKSGTERVDEIELFTSTLSEQNKLIILFSKKDFTKPVLNENKNVTELPAGYTFPMQLPSEKFALWLQTVRSYEKTIQLKQIFLTINK